MPNFVPPPMVQELIERRTYIRIFWDVMNYQLFEVDGHPFSLGKLLMGVILLTLSYLFSLRASRAIERKLFERIQVEESLRYTLGRFSFYLFLIFTWLFTLHVLSVPITIFAVVGSAVAIGVGFGSQNIISNFISGLLVMIERPIRVGDFVELGTISGVVHQIGIRSTLLVTPSNARVVVPNTFFLEKSVTNWTLADDFQSGSVRVGVAYGSDVHKVAAVCLEAAVATESILKTSEPSVLLSDYADSAIFFDIGFMCRASNNGQRKRVESDLRFKIHEVFAKNGIQMPFPQREVRLKTTAPLLVHVASDSRGTV